MPVGVLQMTPGGTQEQYEQLGEKMLGVRSSEFASVDAPEELIMHSAGPMLDGWYVYDVWESQGHVERFFQERVMPAGQELGISRGDPSQFYETHNLIVADAARAT